MKAKSRTASIYHPTDSAELKKQLRQLQQKGFKVLRPHAHQIKVGQYNWYWSTDRITIDPHQRHSESGFEAFLALIERNVSIKRKRIEIDEEHFVLDFPIPAD